MMAEFDALSIIAGLEERSLFEKPSYECSNFSSAWSDLYLYRGNGRFKHYLSLPSPLLKNFLRRLERVHCRPG